MAAIAIDCGRSKGRRMTKDLTDGEGSLSSNDKEFDGGDYGEVPLRKRIKKEKLDDDHENGMDFNDMYDSSPGESDVGASGDPEYLPNGKFSNGKTNSNGHKSLLNTAKMDTMQNDQGTSMKESSKKFNMFWPRNNRPTRRGSGGGRRLSYSPDTDKRLLQWVMERDKNGLTVSREAIQTQALTLIREECPDFKASSGWVEKFLNRHKLFLPTKANMLENGVGKKAIVPVANGTDGVPCPNGDVVPAPETNCEDGEKVEETVKVETNENVKKEVNLMDIPINRRGPARKRVVREFKDDEEDEEDCDPEDADMELEKVVPENVNPERLKAFNMFVRLFVDENLDRLVPISKQPKDKVLAIIHACQRQFPEFRDRARKRIRTYLKSCRRLKKLKEPLKRTADQINAVPSMSSAQMQEVNNILASACANEADLDSIPATPATQTQTAVQPAPPARPPLTNDRAISPAETGGRTSTSTMTSSDTPPPPPVQRLPSLGAAVGPDSLAAARAKAGTEYKLNLTEVTAIRQLIASYRESAAFLYRSADELESLLPTSTTPTQKAVR